VLAAPTLSLVKGGTASNGHLDLSGNWVWNVQIAPSDPIPGTSSPLAAEIGFRESSNRELLNATRLNQVGNFDTENPGTEIFGWECDVAADCPVATNGKPSGLKTNVATDEVFSALGSVDFATTGPKDYIQIVAQGPTTASLSTTVQWLGAYGGNGRVAENNPAGPPPTINHDTYVGSATRTAFPGDANLSGTVDDTDLAALLASFNGTGLGWNSGNFNGHVDNAVNDTDLATLLANFGDGGPVGPGAGAALGGGSAVPEPGSLVLLIVGLGLIQASRRR
jgi:hypothetical protein